MSRLRASTNMYTSLRRSAQQIPESVLSGNFRADSGTRINKSLPPGVMALLITQPGSVTSRNTQGRQRGRLEVVTRSVNGS